ncbi:MAG TPA: PrpF domain-containing protein, partial [Allocoleopsis sp.]
GAHFQEECDLTARIYVFGKIHKAYSATGSICTGVAAALPGSVVNELISAAALQVGQIRIGHPCGTIDVQVQVERAMNHEFIVSEAVLLRTARRLFDGVVYAPYARLL